METFWQDVKYALRSLTRTPGFALVALLTLALGIGANTAMFSVVHSLLVQPLPYADSDRLVAIFLDELDLPGHRDPSAPAFFLAWKERASSFERMTAATPWSPVLTGRDNPAQLTGVRATAELFDLLGVQPHLGRAFVPEHGVVGQNRVVVLGYEVWQREFGGDASIVGQAVQLDGAAYQVIAVMPPRFQFPPFWVNDAEIWTPLVFQPEDRTRISRFLRVFARLKPGVTLAQARAEMDTQEAHLTQEFPRGFSNTAIEVEPLLEPVVGDSRLPLYLLLSAVGMVLLIACANLANLLLVRAVGRQSELAVRAALGASRARLLRQLLTESVLLSAGGSLLGVLLARWLLDALVLFGAGSLPRLQEVRMATPVFVFTAAIAALAAILFGLAPAWRASQVQIMDAVREGVRRTGSGRHNRLRSVLVVAEVALAVVLLASAGLLLKSFWRLQNLDPGFARHNRLTAVMSLGASKYASTDQQPLLFEQLRERIASLPGIEAAGFVNFLPVGGDIWGFGFSLEGRPEPTEGDRWRASFRVISPGYLNAVGTRLLRGRDFTALDTAGSEPVIIINETMERRFWPNGAALGARIRLAGSSPERPWRTIVGVMADAKQWDITQDAQPEVAVPFTQSPVLGYPHATIVLRTDNDPHRLARPLQESVLAVDSNVPLSQIRTMEMVLSENVQEPRFRSALVTGFSALALLLTAVGIYGVMAYTVTQRTREIGIRIALGARPRDIVGHLTGYSARLALLGLAIGFVGSLALGRVLKSLLFELEPTDPATFATVALAMLAVMALATWAPARRAMRTDPMVALRHE